MTFCLSHPGLDPSFQPIAKVYVLYTYIILSFILAVTKVPGHCYMRFRHEKENHLEQQWIKIVFSCLKWDAMQYVRKLKEQVYK